MGVLKIRPPKTQCEFKGALCSCPSPLCICAYVRTHMHVHMCVHTSVGFIHMFAEGIMNTNKAIEMY